MLDNELILKKINPDLWNKLKIAAQRADNNRIKTISSGKGWVNIYVEKIPGEKRFIHQKKDPLKEAKDIFEQYPDIDQYSEVLFYGLGLGYHVDEFRHLYPHKNFTVYEPIPEIFRQYLQHTDLKRLPARQLKNIFLETSLKDRTRFICNYVAKIKTSVLIIELPAYKDIFFDKYQAFLDEFTQEINLKKNMLTTTAAFQKSWVINSMSNFKEILATPNIIIEKKGCFKNKPALLVAAGPSLEEEIENLKQIKDHGLAYIFSVGNAINILLKHDISPHAACTYDPTENNQFVFARVAKEKLMSIPLIFGSSVGLGTVQNYPGPKMHMIISQDTVSRFYLRAKLGDHIEIVNDAPSIAVITLQLLYRLGFNPIILVGLNLAALRSEPEHISTPQQGEGETVIDVYGNPLTITPSFNSMKQQIEMYTALYKDLRVINTSKGGANINGADFNTLDDVLKNVLLDKVCAEDWLDYGTVSYDLSFLRKQKNSIENDFAGLDRLMQKMKYYLHKIDKLAVEEKFNQAEAIYIVLNHVFAQLRENKFFATIIMPMNQIAQKFLQISIADISEEEDPSAKAQKTVEEFGNFLNNCENDLEMIAPLFSQMNDAVDKFLFKQLKAQSNRIKVLIIDCAVLTNDALFLSTDGTEMMQFNSQDQIAVTELKKRGIKIVMVARDNNRFIKSIGCLWQVDDIYLGVARVDQIGREIKQKYMPGWEEAACVLNGSDFPELWTQTGLVFWVPDNDKNVAEKADFICTVPKGGGVIKEIAAIITAGNK